MIQSSDITLTLKKSLPPAAAVAIGCWNYSRRHHQHRWRARKSTFSGFHLARIRRAQRLSRDFEAGIPALGLIMRLLDEVEELRKIQRPLVLLEEE